ncbi:MAG: potassium channel family protein [Hyphomonadaceae bacterium]|nr:potassium channel family protein [Hyphomonadaceae bacterium]
MSEAADAASRHPLRSKLRDLYFGVEGAALKFQGVLFTLDVLIIGFFIAANFIRKEAWFLYVDYGIAAFLVLDVAARIYALGSLRRWIKYPSSWADIVVLATFLVPLVQNFGFLRILRLWALVHRERTWNVLGGGRWDDTYVEDLTKAVVNLVVFIFLASGVAYALFSPGHPKMHTFIDAMYFAVTSLTTTGYGDITLDTQLGRAFKIVLMLSGITLFFGVAQKAFAQHQQRVRCRGCNTDRHEADARYCRVCGERLSSDRT